MPRLKPLDKLVNKARRLRAGHQERHRTTGFGFALADSVDYLDVQRWDTLTAHRSLFLSRKYLRVLEEARPENLRQRYALIFRGREAVAAVAAQRITVSLARVSKTPKHKRVSTPLAKIEEQMLVCGNVLSWGMHGVVFGEGEDEALLWPAVAEALYRLRRADRLLGNADIIMVKDIPDAHAANAEALARFSYRPLETEPNMVLDIAPGWRSFDDYLASLNSKYRKTCRTIEKDVESAGCKVDEIGPSEIAAHAEDIHNLYLQTHHNARIRVVTLSPAFIPRLCEELGSDMRFSVVRRDGVMLGFVTTVRDGDTAVGYYVGFDRKSNAEFPIYFRLLQEVIDHAIKLGCRRLSLGRTALEPKARLGARPDPLRLWIRHRIPMLNVIVRGLLHTISHHDEPPARNPFK